MLAVLLCCVLASPAAGWWTFPHRWFYRAPTNSNYQPKLDKQLVAGRFAICLSTVPNWIQIDLDHSFLRTYVITQEISQTKERTNHVRLEKWSFVLTPQI